MRANRTWNLLYAATFALPTILLFASVRTFREMDAQREVYLRDRLASIAGRLDAIAQDVPLETAAASLAEGEPYLRDLRIISKELAAGNPSVEAVRNGRELFHTEFSTDNGTKVFRAYVPFHYHGEVQVAKIDLETAASDFLVVHARHNVIISIVGGIALVLVSLYSIWAARRASDMEKRQLELQHLAQLGTMSAVLAHEIRNPLGTIKGFVQLAIEQSGSAITPLLAPVVDQARRLESLVNDLLVYGRPPLPSKRLLEWTELESRIEAHGRRLSADKAVAFAISGADMTFETDPDLLEHILVNLIRNAVDAVEKVDAGFVDVRAALEAGSIVIKVRDNGPGIPPSELEKVRQPFFTTKAFGTGLGLPISLRLSAALGGNLEIESDVSGGTVATVRLPANG